MDESVRTPVITRRLSFSSMSCLLKRSVGVAAMRQVLTLVGEGAQCAAQSAPRLTGVDDLVDEAAVGRRLWSAVAAPVVVFQFRAQTSPLVDVGHSVQTPALEDGDGTRCPHHRDLGARPRAAVVVPQALAVHDDVGPAVGLA